MQKRIRVFILCLVSCVLMLCGVVYAETVSYSSQQKNSRYNLTYEAGTYSKMTANGSDEYVATTTWTRYTSTYRTCVATTVCIYYPTATTMDGISNQAALQSEGNWTGISSGGIVRAMGNTTYKYVHTGQIRHVTSYDLIDLIEYTAWQNITP